MEERDGYRWILAGRPFGGVEVAGRMTGGRLKGEEGDVDALGGCGRGGVRDGK